MQRLHLVLFALGTVLAVALSPPALAIHDTDLREAILQYKRAADPKVPRACEDPWVIGQIVGRFNWAEHKTWHRGFGISGVAAPRLRYNEFYGPGLIRTRYCVAEAIFSHGRTEPVFYIVERRMGFASTDDGVTFCIPSLDRWRIYGAACSTVR
jgi:hypothetical protein